MLVMLSNFKPVKTNIACIAVYHSGGTRKFQSTNPRGGAANPLFSIIFTENCIKMIKNWTRGRGGVGWSHLKSATLPDMTEPTRISLERLLKPHVFIASQASLLTEHKLYQSSFSTTEHLLF